MQKGRACVLARLELALSCCAAGGSQVTSLESDLAANSEKPPHTALPHSARSIKICEARQKVFYGCST